MKTGIRMGIAGIATGRTGGTSSKISVIMHLLKGLCLDGLGSGS